MGNIEIGLQEKTFSQNMLILHCLTLILLVSSGQVESSPFFNNIATFLLGLVRGTIVQIGVHVEEIGKAIQNLPDDIDAKIAEKIEKVNAAMNTVGDVVEVVQQLPANLQMAAEQGLEQVDAAVQQVGAAIDQLVAKLSNPQNTIDVSNALPNVIPVLVVNLGEAIQAVGNAIEAV